MQFQLPTNLQIELLAYDPTLKKLARTNNSKTKSTKSKFPLGQPIDIIPQDVLRTSLVQDAIDAINSCPIQQRVHEFKRMNGFAKTMTCAVLYHYESCWYAAWLPPKGQEQDYVYGYSFAYKDNKTSRNMVPFKVTTTEDTQIVKYGRADFITYSRLVTKQDIIGANSGHNWILPSITWGKGHDIREVIKRFEESLKETIPVWDDARGGMFARLKNSNFVSLLELENIIDKELKDTWKPSVDNLFHIIDESVLFPSDYHYGVYRSYKYIRHIIDKPFFRKWIQARCDETIERLSDKDNRLERYVKQPWNQIKHLFRLMLYINDIWPDCPIDYYQTHIDNLLAIYNLHCSADNTRVSTWLNTHMPVASFFTIVEKVVTNPDKRLGTCTTDSMTGLNQYYISDWVDTVNMLRDVLADKESKNETLAPPKRWRLTEFHDYIQGEAWKVKHVNNALPQDLFPEPIKVQVEHTEKVNATSTSDKMIYNINDNLNYGRPILDLIDGHYKTTPVNYTFFQPIDTHQLAAWGQAVRNCVGNASNYADGVRKKKHFIVLAMLDNKPTFTIQLEVDMGMMSVKQIVGISNARLTSDQQDSYTKAFSQALKLQESKLQSA